MSFKISNLSWKTDKVYKEDILTLKILNTLKKYFPSYKIYFLEKTKIVSILLKSVEDTSFNYFLCNDCHQIIVVCRNRIKDNLFSIEVTGDFFLKDYSLNNLLYTPFLKSDLLINHLTLDLKYQGGEESEQYLNQLIEKYPGYTITYQKRVCYDSNSDYFSLSNKYINYILQKEDHVLLVQCYLAVWIETECTPLIFKILIDNASNKRLKIRKYKYSKIIYSPPADVK